MSHTRLQIAIAVPGLPFNGDTLKTESLGGSETAGLCIARELAALGNQVYVFSNGTPGTFDGVQYLPFEHFEIFSATTPHDISIVQRIPIKFASRNIAKMNVLWCHDLALGRSAREFKGVWWNVDKIALLSEYMAGQYRETHNLHDSMVWKTRNGIDLDLFSEAPPKASERKNRKTILYAARPERGLDVLLQKIYPELLRRDPEIKLKVACYDNAVDHLKDFYQDCFRLLGELGGEWLGHLTKKQLYSEMEQAGCYVYPTPSPNSPSFREVSCIAAMECQAAGLPIVTSNIGALTETIAAGAGSWIDLGEKAEWTDESAALFCDSVIEYLTKDDLFDCASDAGRAAAAEMSWATIAAEWHETFIEFLKENNAEPIRLARHFIRRSDIEAAKEVLLDLTLDHQEANELRAYINHHYSFTENMKAHYEWVGTFNPDCYDDAILDGRYGAVRDLVAQFGSKNLIDVGCGQGIYATALSNDIGCRVTGVDIDGGGIAWALRYKGEKSRDPDLLTFIEGELDDVPESNFDGAIACEILEHVEKPWELLTAIEARVEKGGRVYITVPFGPWELAIYDTDKPRGHLWELDPHDLYDMVGKKRGMVMTSKTCSVSTISGDPLGHTYVSYVVDHEPIPPINMERKLFLQRPRQTVTASIMAGPNCEETLLWCLRSIRSVVDKIVIADTGMSKIAKAMALDMGAKLIDAPSPLEAGFETPRNMTLEHINTDWVFWIDTDEKLLDPISLTKYLRSNCFNGYGIRQHHFAVDTRFDPDMPVRLFRRAPYQGKSMRWFGMIHEHPELTLNEGPGPIVVVNDVHIAHMGYLVESGRKQRFFRNYPLLQKDIATYPERLLQKHFIMRDNMLLVGYEMSRNGQHRTENTDRLCRETIAIYRERFLGKGAYQNVDSVTYYSQALQILGEGVDVSFDIAAGRDGIGDRMNGHTLRFASKDDLLKELQWRAETAVEPYLGKFF